MNKPNCTLCAKLKLPHNHRVGSSTCKGIFIYNKNKKEDINTKIFTNKNLCTVNDSICTDNGKEYAGSNKACIVSDKICTVNDKICIVNDDNNIVCTKKSVRRTDEEESDMELE